MLWRGLEPERSDICIDVLHHLLCLNWTNTLYCLHSGVLRYVHWLHCGVLWYLHWLHCGVLRYLHHWLHCGVLRHLHHWLHCGVLRYLQCTLCTSTLFDLLARKDIRNDSYSKRCYTERTRGGFKTRKWKKHLIRNTQKLHMNRWGLSTQGLEGMEIFSNYFLLLDLL